jgi:hypothetical protein
MGEGASRREKERIDRLAKRVGGGGNRSVRRVMNWLLN